jgi:adenylate cyclase
LLQGAFIGRNIEMAELRAGLADAAAGLGRLFLISGQPGIGKTRLVRELAAAAEGSGMRALAGHCSEHDEAVPYVPFVEILERCVEEASDPNDLRTMLGEEGPELAQLLPKLKRLLPDLPPPLELPSQQARRHLFNCFCDFVARVAREQPMLLVLEDLHWADDSTLSLLDHLTQRLSGLPLLVAVTYRDAELNVASELAEALENLLRGRLATELRLTGLRREEVADILSSLSGQAPPAAIAAEFYRETEGNPFFVEELFRHLEEENRLYDSDGLFHTELRVAELEVPRSVRLVVERRLARLSDRTRRTLGTAATIGRLFSFELLEASTKADAGSLLESVEEGERAGLVFSSAESPNARFEFSHELVRQTVLSDLSAPRRQQLHLHIAEALERLYPDALEDHVNDLAHHLWQAGNAADVDKTVRYLEKAAQNALAQSAHHGALGYLQNALELLKKLPDSQERARRELRLQMMLTVPLIAIKGYTVPEVETACRRARELCQQSGENPRHFAVLGGLCSIYLARAELRTAHELAEQMLRLAERNQEPSFFVWAHYLFGHILAAEGELTLARVHLEQTVALYDPKKRRNYGSVQDPGVTSLGPLAHVLYTLGYPDQALGRSLEGLALARKLSHPYSLAWALGSSAAIHRRRGEMRVALQLEDERIALCTDLGFSRLAASAVMWRGGDLVECGFAEEGVGQIRLGLGMLADTESERLWGLALLLPDAYAKTGRLKEALAMLDESLRAVESAGRHDIELQLYPLKGEVLVMQDPAVEPEAEQCFRRAIEIARRHSAKTVELRAATGLARLLAKQGRRDEARTMLAKIYNWFTEGFDTRDLKDAKALLDELNR